MQFISFHLLPHPASLPPASDECSAARWEGMRGDGCGGRWEEKGQQIGVAGGQNLTAAFLLGHPMVSPVLQRSTEAHSAWVQIHHSARLTAAQTLRHSPSEPALLGLWTFVSHLRSASGP